MPEPCYFCEIAPATEKSPLGECCRDCLELMLGLTAAAESEAAECFFGAPN